MDLEPKPWLENQIYVIKKYYVHTVWLHPLKKRKQETYHKRGSNHLSCKRDFCPCQNSKSCGVSLYPPQFLGLGIKLLQAKNMRIICSSPRVNKWEKRYICGQMRWLANQISRSKPRGDVELKTIS